MAMLNVQPHQLRELSAAFRTEADELRVRAVRLGRATEPMLTEWAGAASSAFQRVAHSMETHQRALIEDYDAMATLLANVAAAFESTDSNIASALE